MDPKFLNTDKARDHIRDQTGHKISSTYLKKLRCIGGGPEFQHWGRFVVYPLDALDTWITSRFTSRRRSTSDTGMRHGPPQNTSEAQAA